MTTPEEPLPELHVRLASSRQEKIDAFKLITDSLAQQGQTLNRSIIFHPYTLSAAIALFGVVFKLNFSRSDWGTMMILCAGITIALLSLLGRWTGGWTVHVEELAKGGAFEKRMEGKGREVIVAVWGGRVIGTVVMERVRDVLEVWGWTVERKYRGNGMGKDLLRSAVNYSKAHNCKIRFAKDHASSFRLDKIPVVFNAKLDSDNAKSRKTLEDILAE